jgi:XTP/dITP diphosphohydrolase
VRRLAPGRLVLATHNAGKAREFADLFSPFDVALKSAAELGLPEPEETGATMEANAALKALAAAHASRQPALADDSGFCVDALAGAPGVYTADWAKRPDGSRDYAMAMEKLHALAQHAPDRSGAVVAVLCLAWPDGHTETVRGEARGHWVWPPRGAIGFGYDPMFVPDGAALTFSEMELAEKQRHNHRARAFAALAPLLPPRGP